MIRLYNIITTALFVLSFIGIIYYTVVGIHESAWICVAILVIYLVNASVDQFASFYKVKLQLRARGQ